LLSAFLEDHDDEIVISSSKLTETATIFDVYR